MAKTKSRTKRTSPAKKKTRATTARKTSRPATKRTAKPTAKSRSRAKESMRGSLLQEFFTDALQDIYWAEKALTKALPKMTKSATSEELKNAFNEHLEVTMNQIERLEQVFELLGQKAKAKKCEAMQGLVEEAQEIMSETKDDTFTRDAALIIAAQKVEHYEIASYGGLVQLARTMNREDVAKLLGETLDEEKEADHLLTQVAESNINMQAAGEDEEGESSLKESVKQMFS